MANRTLLVGVDGSPASERAVEVACSMAAEDDAQLIFVHVLQPSELGEGELAYAQTEHIGPRRRPTPESEARPEQPPVRPAMTGAARGVPLWMTETARAPAAAGSQGEVAQRLGDMILQRACSVAADHGRGRVQAMTESGDPAKAITDAARRCHADAVVLGSRGLGGLGSMVLGSVSRKVAKKVECPCIVVT